MIAGRVTDSRRALLELRIRDGNGNWRSVSTALDTGFTGYLALPESFVRQFGLILNRRRRVASATQASTVVPSGVSHIVWSGRELTVQVIQAGTRPLLGMALLWNHRITIDAVPNGPVAITPIGG